MVRKFETRTYPIHRVASYINWLYFFHAWGFPARFGSVAKVHGCKACRAGWVSTFAESERARAREAIRLYDDACEMLNALEGEYHTHARLLLVDAQSEGDDVVITLDGGHTERLSFLRQQIAGKDGYCLCLSDFIRPATSGVVDAIGLFASTVDSGVEEGEKDDDYRHLLRQTLADRLAEATAECFHEEVRKTIWGYAPDEQFTADELFVERYQGKRPAVGYPSLPDQSLNFQIGRLLDFPSLGITLTETGSMRPHGSTSGLMLSHPMCRHFSVGAISEEQLMDYAKRKGVEAETLRPYIMGNLD